jgi:hypothetical protein
LPASAVLDETKRRYVSSIAREIRNRQTDQERLRGEVLVIVEIVEWGIGLHLFEEVLLLVQGVEWIFIIDGLWEAWLRILRSIVYGAKAADNKAALAWAFHECGTRALCIGDAKSASDLLNQAYRTRTELGDVEGANASLQNLKQLKSAPIIPRIAITLGVGFVILLGILIPWLGLVKKIPVPRPRENAAAAWVSLPLGPVGEFSLSPSLVFQLRGILGEDLHWSHALLFVPSILPFFVVVGLALILYRCPPSVFWKVAKETFTRLRNPVVALFGALIFVQLLKIDGERASTRILGDGLANGAGACGFTSLDFLALLAVSSRVQTPFRT